MTIEEQKKIKICVIGSINYDRIIPYQGEEIRSYGGILYNTIPLATLFGEGGIIHPLSRVGEEHYNSVKEILQPFGNIEAEGIKISEQGTNEYILRYISHDRREEVLKSRIAPLSKKDVNPYLDSDLFLFNFVSGFEIERDAIQEAKEVGKGFVFIDVHNKVFGMKENGERFPHAWRDWQDWLKYADIVQMNEVECGLLVGEELTDDIDGLVRVAMRVIETGPSQILVTLGTKGSLIVHRVGEEIYQLVVTVTSHKVKDTTGCGDSFSAGYVFGILKGWKPRRALTFANTVAGENCEVRGLGNIGKGASEIEERMKKEYKDLLIRFEQGWEGNVQRAN